jgi:hypothetical protein
MMNHKGGKAMPVCILKSNAAVTLHVKTSKLQDRERGQTNVSYLEGDIIAADKVGSFSLPLGTGADLKDKGVRVDTSMPRLPADGEGLGLVTYRLVDQDGNDLVPPSTPKPRLIADGFTFLFYDIYFFSESQ